MLVDEFELYEKAILVQYIGRTVLPVLKDIKGPALSVTYPTRSKKYSKKALKTSERVPESL